MEINKEPVLCVVHVVHVLDHVITRRLWVKYTVGWSKITSMFKVQSKSDYIAQSTLCACRNTF